ncbi:MAG: hypothetical protein QOK29_2753 [Rhodospirillaceae bacterium]|jgi:hypothetical protein|nr:hypothetical protein [Rhodospirillaceae bacterium]
MHPTEKEAVEAGEARRAALKKLGRFAVVTAPAVTLLLAAQTRPARAVVISVK